MTPRPIAATGGRREAERRLAAIDPQAYGASRNHLDGAVTRLSPYIRHGVLTLAEVREAVFGWLRARGYGQPESQAEGRRIAGKLINELGWRDYWQRLWRLLGDGIWSDLEPLKTGHHAASYAPDLPADVAAAGTGLVCIDAFARELIATGWLHNHARMWLASYLVHWRRVRWQAGAAWFLRHLLDGDPASNNLSWQWLASSFSAKPYIFNRDNLERYSAGRYCRACPRAGRDCPFEASYEQLQQRLFPRATAAGTGAGESGSALSFAGSAAGAASFAPSLPANAPSPRRPVLWIHGEALGPANPALRALPGAPALFVFDADLAPGRLRFLRECLAELPVSVRSGDGAAGVLAFAAEHGADGVVTSAAVDPRFAAIAATIAAHLPLQVLPVEPFVDLELAAAELRRFSRYWRRAEPLVWAGFSRSGQGSAAGPPAAARPPGR
jgi:deoxyribodipyrimidine photo-lyase